MLRLEEKAEGEPVAPLEKVVLLGAQHGPVIVEDGQGREYFRAGGSRRIAFCVGGSPGWHRITAGKGKQQNRLLFRVEAQTHIRDKKGEFDELLAILHHTMRQNPEKSVLWEGKIYTFFIRWLRDHVHTMKGMKYFSSELKSAIDLYRESARRDGMIWDNVYKRDSHLPNTWDMRFHYGNFIRSFRDSTAEFKRIPVENDVEYLFVEGIYYTWKATGDTGWMLRSLNAAVRALEYSVQSPYRWSRTYQLLKRGFTIDTWDFQNAEDAQLSAGNDPVHKIFGDPMVIKPGHTRFGIFHGDNTGYIAACHYLAEMLECAGRDQEAKKYRKRAEEMKNRLDALAWNGSFYRHHVPEDKEVKRDLGVDLESQISLSNAYALNRGISHEQAVAIIRSYQELRRRLPPGSPGEWYLIYPPFERGFERHNAKWQYMNGGVSPIVAGELAHGAFEHGYEHYGVDILRRMRKLAKQHRNILPCVFTGALAQEPQRSFSPLDLSGVVNIDFSGNGAPGVPGWTGEGENDLREMPVGKQTFAGIPFHITDPARNGRRGCLGISSRPGYRPCAEITITKRAQSIYFLHALASASDGIAGSVTLEYSDGSQISQNVIQGKHILGWWMPSIPVQQHGSPQIAMGWHGRNPICPNVGLVVWGLNNPHPDKQLTKIILKAGISQSIWLVAAITLCDQPVWFPTDPVSFGIPESWGAGAVTYALVEGLAGVKDEAVAFQTATVAPRWIAANADDVKVCIAYPTSSGYVAYSYRHLRRAKIIEINLTGSGNLIYLRVLLPAASHKAKRLTIDGNATPFRHMAIERSHYVEVELAPLPPRLVRIYYT